MRIAIYSDIHTEAHHGADGEPDFGEAFIASLDPSGVDAVILAGDIGSVQTLPTVIRLFAARFRRVLLVCGNHEHWHTSRGYLHETLIGLMVGISNFHWLNHSTVTIKGQRFLGTTLWFRDDPLNFHYQGMYADFQCVPVFRHWVYEENRKALAFLEHEVRDTDVVITHHAPSTFSRQDGFKASPTNRFYVCELTPFIQQRQPRLWVHGHMHQSFDYQIDRTRVVCNPYGYQTTFLNARFDPRKVVEI